MSFSFKEILGVFIILGFLVLKVIKDIFFVVWFFNCNLLVKFFVMYVFWDFEFIRSLVGFEFFLYWLEIFVFVVCIKIILFDDSKLFFVFFWNFEVFFIVLIFLVRCEFFFWWKGIFLGYKFLWWLCCL